MDAFKVLRHVLNILAVEHTRTKISINSILKMEKTAVNVPCKLYFSQTFSLIEIYFLINHTLVCKPEILL